MKHIISTAMLMFFGLLLFGQKLFIDSTAPKNLQGIESIGLNNKPNLMLQLIIYWIIVITTVANFYELMVKIVLKIHHFIRTTAIQHSMVHTCQIMPGNQFCIDWGFMHIEND